MIHLSDAAAAVIIQKLVPPSIAVRLTIVSGGCSGFKAEFDYIDQSEDDDIAVGEDSLLFIDPISAAKIDGSTIDYESGLMKQNFIIHNPEMGCCGCGKSFT